MRRKIVALIFVMLTSGVAAADDLEGAQAFLCTPSQVTVCTMVDGCETGPLWKWDIPSFIIVDLKNQMLSTTKASGLERTTPIQKSELDGDHIFVQGTELGRGYTIVIDEDAGHASFAVVTPEFAITAFGVCTTAEPAE
jgi:hypothetical protein